ncbi:MAG: rhombosortase, partial [Campylobacterota bacterium]
MDFLKKHSLPLFLITASLLLALWGESSLLSLRYERNGISNGEIWRLFSGHLLHTGWMHLWFNLAALITIWLIVQHYLSTLFWWMTALFCSIGISLGLYIIQSGLEWYVGLSGLLHGLLVAGAIAGIVRGRRELTLLLIIVYAKVVWELFYGPLSTNIVALKGDIIVDAHLYGVLTGTVS